MKSCLPTATKGKEHNPKIEMKSSINYGNK